MKKTFQQIVELFEEANKRFLAQASGLLADHVAERTLCGELKDHLRDIINQDHSFFGYYVDVEYNRNRGSSVEKHYKTIFGPRCEIIKINCDLIVHSRGWIPEQDNLLAVEMKKYEPTTRYRQDRQRDRERLMAMTKDTYSDKWDGVGLPEHICRYVLGVFYEIDLVAGLINLEYYCKGRMINRYSIPLHY